MIPTSDQVARAIIAAAKECGFYQALVERPRMIEMQPKKGNSGARLRHTKVYTALALRAAFPACPSPAIGRFVGVGKPHLYLGVILSCKAKGEMKWYDPEVEARVTAAIGACDPNPVQRIVDESELSPALPALALKSSMGTLRRAFDDRPASKRRLEEELRQAVLNTGGRIE
jgi:hypothetical protein